MSQHDFVFRLCLSAGDFVLFVLFGVVCASVRNFVLILALAAASLLMAGCERAPAKSRVVGTYSGTLSGASESLILHADGTFSQQVSLPSGQRITGSGTWTLRHKAIDLSGYMHFYSEEKSGVLVPPEQATLTYTWGADMLIRDWGSGYYTLKHG